MPRILTFRHLVSTNSSPATHSVRPDWIDLGWPKWLRSEHGFGRDLDRGFDVVMWNPFGIKNRNISMPYTGYDQALQSDNKSLVEWAKSFGSSLAKARIEYPETEFVCYNGSLTHDIATVREDQNVGTFDDLFYRVSRGLAAACDAGISYADDAIGVADPGSFAEAISLAKHRLFSNDPDPLSNYYIEPMVKRGSLLKHCNIMVIDEFWRRVRAQQADPRIMGTRHDWAEPLGKLTGEIVRLVGFTTNEMPNYVTDLDVYRRWHVSRCEEILGEGHSVVIQTFGLDDDTLDYLAKLNASMKSQKATGG